MAENSQITTAKVGATLSWRDLENAERKAEGLPPLPEANTEPEIIGGMYGDEPRMVVPDAVEEDYQNAKYASGLPYRTGWPSRDDAATASRGLIVAALLVFVAVAALLGVAFAV